LVTAKLDKHCIFIGHEDTPTMSSDNKVIQEITVLLGGSLKAEVPSQLSEVWHMRESNFSRYVEVRQVGLHKPIKTRMFDASQRSEFIVSDKLHNHLTPLGDLVTLSSLVDAWKANNYNKIQLPK